MARAYSLDLRERVVAAARERSCRAVAALFDVSVSSVVKWAQRARATGSAAAKPMGGKRRRLLEPHRGFLLARLDGKPDLTLHALLDELRARGVIVSCDTLWRFLRREGKSFKKTSPPPSSCALMWPRRRVRWKLHQKRIDPSRLVSVDETWAKTNMTRTHGWWRRGKPLPAKVTHGRWRMMTFLAALCCDRITAPFAFEGAMNGEAFETYVEDVLTPTLRPGDLVIMDNLGSHKGRLVRRAIRKAGAHLFFLPPYSPDLNPIEQVFSKLKRALSKADKRSLDALWPAIGQILKTFSPQECANYFKAAGYAST